MKLTRRQIIGILSIGGIGAAGYVYSQAEDPSIQENPQSETTRTATTTATQTAAKTSTKRGENSSESSEGIDFYEKINSNLENLPERRPSYNFSYNSVDLSVDEFDLFDRFQAAPNSARTGDRLILTPGARSTSELASLLMDIWNVTEDKSVDTKINDVDVSFTGSETFGTGYLIATTSANREAPVVLASRGENMAVAKELTQSFEEFLE